MDFSPSTIALTFQPGETIQCGSVIIVNDSILENQETFFVVLNTTDPDVIITTPDSANVTIQNDDGNQIAIVSQNCNSTL